MSFLRPLGLFFLLLLIFVLKNGWYIPTEIVINGTIPDGKGIVELSWDSGSGYNTYEKIFFPIHAIPDNLGNLSSLQISYTGKKNFASSSTSFTCSGLVIDGRHLALRSHALYAAGQQGKAGLYFTKPGDEFRVDIEASKQVSFTFETHGWSGIVEVEVNGLKSTHDLYTPNVEAKRIHVDYWLADSGKRFVVSSPLPRYGIRELQVKNGKGSDALVIEGIILTGGEKAKSLLSGATPLDSQHEPLTFREVNEEFRDRFDHIQLGWQVLFAALTTWIIFGCSKKVSRIGGMKKVFSGQRKVFWGFFIFSFLIYLAWLLVFWPGVLSVDSLKVWRAANLPEIFLNDHPLLNVLFYSFLSQIWNNVTVVPLFHIGLLSLLIAFIFYRLYTQRVSFVLLLPFFMALVFSIPISLYNIVLWKDIPFALLVVFWAYSLADFYRKHRQGERIFTLESGLAYLLLFLAVGLVRHNGIVYFAVIPCYFLLMGLIPLRRYALVIVGLFIVGCCSLLLMSHFVEIGDSGYLLQQGNHFMGSFFRNSILANLERTWSMYWGVWDITQTKSNWDLWHYFQGDRTAYSFLKHAGWNDVYPYISQQDAPLAILRDFALHLYWKSYDFPWVYFTWNPVYMLGIYLVAVVGFRWFPLSGIYSCFILVQVFVLLFFINILNWRYYYFLYVGAFFLVPMMLWDYRIRKCGRGIVSDHEV